MYSDLHWIVWWCNVSINASWMERRPTSTSTVIYNLNLVLCGSLWLTFCNGIKWKQVINYKPLRPCSFSWEWNCSRNGPRRGSSEIQVIWFRMSRDEEANLAVDHIECPRLVGFYSRPSLTERQSLLAGFLFQVVLNQADWVSFRAVPWETNEA